MFGDITRIELFSFHPLDTLIDLLLEKHYRPEFLPESSKLSLVFKSREGVARSGPAAYLIGGAFTL